VERGPCSDYPNCPNLVCNVGCRKPRNRATTENVKHVDPAQAIAGVAAELRYADGMQSSRHREWADRLQAAIAALQREAAGDGEVLARLNAALGESFKDDPANAVRAHAAVLPLLQSAPRPTGMEKDCGEAGHEDGRCGNAQCLPSATTPASAEPGEAVRPELLLAIGSLRKLVSSWAAQPFAAVSFDASQEKRVIRDCLAMVDELYKLATQPHPEARGGGEE
jgi:hypothetical protein